tara:strand:+ start:220 stop:411 length:192 start_codon:yes stop_codon:yes gene_type:complete
MLLPLILRLLFISELLGVTAAAARVFLIIIIIIIKTIITIFEKWEGADTTRAMYRRNESAREI